MSNRDMIEATGGSFEELVGPLPDGSGFFTASFPLPKDHWLYAEGKNEPPDVPEVVDAVSQLAWIRACARYAIRSATANGKIADFDPDAMVQQFVIGVFGRPE